MPPSTKTGQQINKQVQRTYKHKKETDQSSKSIHALFSHCSTQAPRSTCLAACTQCSVCYICYSTRCTLCYELCYRNASGFRALLQVVESIPKCHEEESQEEAECSSKFSHLKEMNGQNCEKQYSPSELNFLKNSLPKMWMGWMDL